MKKGIDILKKLPVIEIVIEALKFPWVKFVPLLRRTGLSLAILIGISVLLSVVIPTPDVATATPEDIQRQVMFSFLIGLPIIMLVYAIFINGSIQVVTGHPLGTKIFSFGGREIRFLLFIPLFIAIAAAVGTLTYLVFLATSGSGFEFVSIIVFFVALYWLAMRLTPLYGFVAIENRFAVREAWAASRGKALRIFGIWLLFLLICLVLLIPIAAISYAFLLNDLQTAIEAVNNGEDSLVLIDEMNRSSAVLNLILLPVNVYLFFAIFGAMGLIYKHLKEGQTGEPVTLEDGETA